MATQPFSVPPSLNLKEFLDWIDARMESLDLLEQSLQLHKEEVAVMGRRLEVQHKLLRQMLVELLKAVCGLHALAAQSDLVPAKKATPPRKGGV
jgi:hypothetical protein